MRKEFNLLDEPWVKVITPSLEQKEVSLTDVLIRSHEYRNLSGEMPTQDAAVLRVLLAVVITIFYRYNEEGEKEELSEENYSDRSAVLDRWRAYWEKGRLSAKAVQDYLESCRERFWLFHPETPFWQVNDLEYGTDYNAECLFGNMKESMNKATKHHFSMVDGEELRRLSYREGTRWLIHLNAYAVNIKTDKKAPGPNQPVGIGRLGQLGFVMVNGENLFQILMLNLCPLNGNDLWKPPEPAWEQEVRREQGYDISPPDNLPELYTIQSRRILLKRDAEGYLTGFRALGGDFFSVEDAFNEPMTLWRKKSGNKKDDRQTFIPKRHNPAVHAWREFPTLMKGGEEDRTPGIVQWMNTLCKNRLISSAAPITFRMIGMVYGDQMSYTYGDCVNDTLAMSAGLLDDLGKIWVVKICDEVYKCQAVAEKALSHFSNKMCRLLYGTGAVKNSIKTLLVSQYYFLVDHGFREWLIHIEPSENKREDKLAEWERRSFLYARKTVEDYIRTLSPNVYMNKKVDNELLTVPKILRDYLRELYKIYPVPNKKSLKEEGKEE